MLLDLDISSYSDAPQKCWQGPQRGTHEDDVLEGDRDNMVIPGEGNLNLLPEAWAKQDGTGETHKWLSWIWCTSSIPNTDKSSKESGEENDKILCLEWVKSRAHAARASEEVLLMHEEMWRTLLSLEWRSGWWVA